MPSPATLLVVFASATLLLVLVLAWRPDLAQDSGGRVFAFIVLFLLPVFGGVMAARTHLEHSRSTSFCLSCHVMEPFGASLEADAPYLAASHYQNHLVPSGQACYSCHTDYTMYGGLAAKWRGLQHVYAYYIGGAPEPEAIRLYGAYNNRECLYCHDGAKSFEEFPMHRPPEMREALQRNETSCLLCHRPAHGVGQESAEARR